MRAVHTPLTVVIARLRPPRWQEWGVPGDARTPTVDRRHQRSRRCHLSRRGRSGARPTPRSELLLRPPPVATAPTMALGHRRYPAGRSRMRPPARRRPSRTSRGAQPRTGREAAPIVSHSARVSTRIVAGVPPGPNPRLTRVRQAVPPGQAGRSRLNGDRWHRDVSKIVRSERAGPPLDPSSLAPRATARLTHETGASSRHRMAPPPDLAAVRRACRLPFIGCGARRPGPCRRRGPRFC